ncbi:IS3 family transposase [Liquorilactobacillus nagelii]|uniref:IS3 family transposase n=1 Tax=Liquorilactobacillus nagelii TaxID=82688 RepID=UPI001CC8EF1B|nr:IS3 family transposase [Liquorilactobacillus nagelii]ULQ50007.1 IS3 family transposase [Liquorilactobacillus nagelii]
MIYPLIKQESDVGNHTISMMCQVLSVSRPDYYRWLHHEPTKRECETKDLKERISRIWLTSEKRYGAGKILRKIQQELVPLNRTCSIKRLQRLMKQLGIRSITRKKWRPVTIKKETTQERPNLLKQYFSTNELIKNGEYKTNNCNIKTFDELFKIWFESYKNTVKHSTATDT